MRDLMESALCPLGAGDCAERQRAQNKKFLLLLIAITCAIAGRSLLADRSQDLQQEER